jgi:hypothetical protein
VITDCVIVLTAYFDDFFVTSTVEVAYVITDYATVKATYCDH